MNITLEISCYPFSDTYGEIVRQFVERITAHPEIEVSVGVMSSVVVGSYDAVMSMLSSEMRRLMEDHPAVFTLKITNACGVS